MKRLALVLMAVAFAVFALPLVAVSHSPPGEVALAPENVGLESSTVLAGQVIYRDAAIMKTAPVIFDSGNDYLMPAVVRGDWSPVNGCVATTTAGSIWERDHRPTTYLDGGTAALVMAIRRQSGLPDIYMRV